MENKKGSGIFLGIVSIATLIVAIIGATFAYFSASTESNEGAVGLQAYEYKLTLSVSPVYPEGASALIPLNPNTKLKDDKGNYVKFEEGKLVNTESEADAINNLHYALNVAKNKCIDDSGLQVCALYQVEITNDATNEVILTGELETTNNTASTKPGRTPFSNLTYQNLIGDHTKNNLTATGEPVTLAETVGEAVKIGDIRVTGAYTDTDGRFVQGKGTAYILVYLNDIGDQTSQMGASFAGKLKYTSKDGVGNTLTGTFKVSAPEPEPAE